MASPKMRLYLGILPFLFFAGHVASKDPTLYEFYTAGGIQSGLKANHADHFTLNGKPLVLFSGTLHYFRALPDYWPRILRSFKAAGLNSVQVYVPWNRHEDTPGNFDFESPWLNLGNFLNEVKKADMFAVLRPGPFINAEWEFGGMPSWLLRDENMKPRTNYQPYLDRVNLYWTQVMKIINQHTFAPNGGPVLMVQLENEYSGFNGPEHFNETLSHIRYLLNLTKSTGYNQQMFTCDNESTVGKYKNKTTSIPELFEAINFGQGGYSEPFLTHLRENIQPNKPIYISEYWSGWFDFWGQNYHSTTGAVELVGNAEKMMLKFNASVNFYPMLGGTAFGFWNGAIDNSRPIIRSTTSYDFDSPISEGHNYTEKYWLIVKLHQKLVESGRLPKLATPKVPKIPPLMAYGKVAIKEYLSLEHLLEIATKFENVLKPVTMEMLDHGPGYGQRYGFVNYRVRTKPVKEYKVTGPIQDRGVFLIDGIKSTVIPDATNFTASIPSSTWARTVDNDSHTVDMLVENQGRANHKFLTVDWKGIGSEILLDGVKATNLTIYSLDFNQTYMKQVSALNTWLPISRLNNQTTPRLYRTELQIESEPHDTYLELPGWTKGNVFVNDFNIGRYWKIGPQLALYIPAPLLKKGTNTIQVLELEIPGKQLQFIDHPIWLKTK